MNKQSGTVRLDSRLRLTVVLDDGTPQSVQLDSLGANQLAEALLEYSRRDTAASANTNRRRDIE
jgi:hypothetical protein